MQKGSSKTGRMVRMAVLVAIIIIMSFTPLGFLPIGALSFTLLPIPVAIGAILYGPTVGAGLGALFGILSFVRALMGLDLGPVLLAINPLLTAVGCIVPRILSGWLGGLLFKGLYRIDKTKLASFAVSGFSVAAFNTVFFMGSLLLLFWNSFVVGYAQSAGVANSVLTIVFFIYGGVLVQALIESLLCAAVSGAVAKILTRFFPEGKGA